MNPNKDYPTLARVRVVHVVDGTMRDSLIEPEATSDIRFEHFDNGRGFEAEVFNVVDNKMMRLPASSLRRWGEANEDAERDLFERTMYAHYLIVRKARGARGQGVAYDTEEPRPREQLFARKPFTGEYVAVVYQAAWSGWNMSRGVL